MSLLGIPKDDRGYRRLSYGRAPCGAPRRLAHAEIVMQSIGPKFHTSGLRVKFLSMYLLAGGFGPDQQSQELTVDEQPVAPDLHVLK